MVPFAQHRGAFAGVLPQRLHAALKLRELKSGCVRDESGLSSGQSIGAFHHACHCLPGARAFAAFHPRRPGRSLHRTPYTQQATSLRVSSTIHDGRLLRPPVGGAQNGRLLKRKRRACSKYGLLK
jgi:hypothetical protein